MNKWIPYPRFLIRKNIVKSLLRGEDLKLKKGIEIGYGSGEMLMYFLRRKLKIAGFDESKLAFNVAKERLNQQNCIVDLYQTYLDIPKNNFDFLFAFEVLEHIENDSATLDNWLDLLKRNGKIIISVPAHQNRFGKLDLSVGHFRRYDKNNLINILTSKGLQIIHFWNYGFPAINLTEKFSSLLINNNRNTTKFLNKVELSYKSFQVNNSFLVSLISNDIVLFPFYMLQHMFLKTDLGTGYIILAQKGMK